MKFKVGEYWRTRDGRKARIICVDRKINFPVIALVQCDQSDNEWLENYDANGLHVDGQNENLSLIEPWTNPPEEIEVFEWMYYADYDNKPKWCIADFLSTEEDVQKRGAHYGVEYRKTGRSWKVPK